MRLIDADAIEYEPLIDSIGNGMYSHSYHVYEGVIDAMPTIDAVPVSFIKAEIDLMNLKVQIAMSEGDVESAEKWITRLSALIAVIGRWKATEEE